MERADVLCTEGAVNTINIGIYSSSLMAMNRRIPVEFPMGASGHIAGRTDC